MNEKNLLQNSKAYHENNDYYEIFSAAEDGENKVTNYLKEIAENKIVLDAGCGTGKFLNTLENVANKYVGIDLSFDQLIKAQAKSKKNTSLFLNSNLKDTYFKDSSFDLIISPWVLGTITDIKERQECLEELKRLLKKDGHIIFIENEVGSEFEYLRNRDKDNRTIDYNNWILNNNFKAIKTFDTYFNFKTKEIAQKCFLEIYGEEVANKITNKKIEHKITIFEFTK